MSKLFKKCLQCGADVLENQKFCIECGALQEVKMRSKEEIEEMRKQIFKMGPPESSNTGLLLFSMTTYIAMDTILKWVLGLENDARIFNLLKAKTSREKI